MNGSYFYVKPEAQAGYWSSNLEILAKRFPQLLSRLLSVEPTGKVQVYQARNGMETVALLNKAGQELSVHSRYNPQAEAERIAQSIPYEKIFLLIIYGLGLGYHIRAILPRLNKKCRLVVIEPDVELLRAALERVDLRDLLAAEPLFLTAGSQAEVEQDLAKLIHTTHLFVVSNMHFVVLPYCEHMYKDFVRGTQERLFALIHSMFFEIGNDIGDTLTGLRQSFANLDIILSSPSLADLSGVYTGKPAIVVSAGPSLKKNVDLLGQAKGKALILATDAVLKLLLQKNIIPDAVFSVERGIEIFNYFYKDVNIPEEVVLVGLALVSPEVYRYYPGRKLVCFRETELMSEWIDQVTGANSLLRVGGSVAHLAFSFARHLGADPIVFIGQDLAYSPEGYSHGVGDYLGEKVDLSKVEVFVPGYDGKPLPSTVVWKNFLTWFETEIAQTNARCIDATEGGARIRGTEIMTLREVIDRYCQTPIPPLYTVLPERTEINRKERAEKVKKAIKEQEWRNRRLQKKAIKAVKYIQEMLNIMARGGARTAGEIRRVRKLLEWIDRALLEIFGEGFLRVFIQTLVATAHFRINALGVVDTPDKLKQSLLIQYNLYTQIAGVIEIINQELERIANEIKLT